MGADVGQIIDPVPRHASLVLGAPPPPGRGVGVLGVLPDPGPAFPPLPRRPLGAARGRVRAGALRPLAADPHGRDPWRGPARPRRASRPLGQHGAAVGGGRGRHPQRRRGRGPRPARRVVARPLPDRLVRVQRSAPSAGAGLAPSFAGRDCARARARGGPRGGRVAAGQRGRRHLGRRQHIGTGPRAGRRGGPGAGLHRRGRAPDARDGRRDPQRADQLHRLRRRAAPRAGRPFVVGARREDGAARGAPGRGGPRRA